MKFPFYHQYESSDCGPTCLKMIAAYYGKKYSLNKIKEYCEVTRIGVSLKDVTDGGKKMHFTTVAIKVTDEEIDKMPLPAILYWGSDHYVVLYNIKKIHGTKIYAIADPSFGKTQIEIDILKSRFYDSSNVGIAILLEPNKKFKDSEVHYEKQSNILKLLHLAKEVIISRKLSFIISIVLLCLSLAFNWVIPTILKEVVDKGILLNNLSVVWKLMVVQLAFFIGYILSSNISHIILMKTNFQLSVDYLSKYLFKLIKLPISFFDTRLNTELIQRMGDQERIQNYLTFELIEIVFAVANLIVFSIMLFSYSPLSFFIFISFSALAFVWVSFFLKKRKINDYSRFAIDSVNRNTVNELIMGMSEIKINNAHNEKINGWQHIQQKSNSIKLRGLHLDYYQSIGGNFLNKVKDIIITTIIAMFIINENMTLGMLSSIGYILGQLTGPIGQLINTVKFTQDALLSFTRMEEIGKKEEENNSEKVQPPSVNDGIIINNISFKYGGKNSPLVLKNITTTIPKGKKTAIVGVSGSGKTTLLKLLLSFYSPQYGEILLDSIPMSSIDSDKWRDKCGVVLQDGFIFSGTVSDNIAISDPIPNINKLRYAAKLACIDSFIEMLPMKYNTKIGQSGIIISGGQKQRILIARAIYKDPEFIFFDEATNTLDANNERMIVDNLENFYQNKTVVIIAHRLSTVRHAEKIIVLENGSIIEEGSHEYLIAKEGAYYTLVKNQLELGS